MSRSGAKITGKEKDMRRKVKCRQMRDVALENLKGFVLKSNTAREAAAKQRGETTRTSPQAAILGHPLNLPRRPKS